MLSALLSGLRSLRVSLVTGGVIVSSAYIFLYDLVNTGIKIRQSASSLLEFSPLVPSILFISLCLIVGSLYSTLLEGIVDSLHRKIVINRNKTTPKGLLTMLHNSIAPYSAPAEKRLKLEVLRFHKENYFDDSKKFVAEVENDFVDKVLIETLWMEGKLAGTDLESPYDKIRSEGEMRLAGGLLIPLATTATAFSLSVSNWWIVTLFLIGVGLAIPTVNYGLYYYKKANSFLAHHIADGKVLSPSMESLKRIKNSKSNI